jgi:hypothetical protein
MIRRWSGGRKRDREGDDPQIVKMFRMRKIKRRE